jgi:hypothetical protein
MKSLKVSKNEALTNEGKEKLFQLLENNNEFFKETLEVMLTLVISDPKLTYQVADLIESDYRKLYLAMLKNQEQDDKNGLPSCCQTPKNL